jgi:hypothetical protein
MSAEIIQRVAKAIQMSVPDEISDDEAVATAIEVIEAMREPSKAMSDAGWTLAEAKQDAFETCTPRMIYRAMIAAALPSPPSSLPSNGEILPDMQAFSPPSSLPQPNETEETKP